MNERLISRDKSVIPALDIKDLHQLDRIVRETTAVEGIGGYKVGFSLALRFGLPQVVSCIRGESNLPIIYDHQKAGTDIPDTGDDFAAIMVEQKLMLPFYFLSLVQPLRKDGLKCFRMLGSQCSLVDI